MSADFTPSKGEYITLTPFRYWCQKILPLVYDDSLSYYELLCKVVDYLNKTMEDVDTLNTDVTNVFTAYGELQSYVNNYFDNLDVSEEINEKLDNMASDGSLSALMQPFITEDVSDWLEENIEPTTPAVDKSLTILNAAADSAITGYRIQERTGYGLNNKLDEFTKTDRTVAGITFRWVDHWCIVSGTATDNAFCNIYANENALPNGFSVGDKIYPWLVSRDNCRLQIFVYQSGQLALIYDTTGVKYLPYVVIPTNSTGMVIRLFVENGDSVNTRCLPIVTKNYNLNDLPEFDNTIYVNPVSGDNAPMINALLANYDVVHLENGTYNIQSQIIIPNNKTLEGDGASTMIKNVGDIANAIAVNLNSVIRNLVVDGGLTSTPTTQGNKTGIIVYQINDKCWIENVLVNGFSDSGIKILDCGGATIPKFVHNCVISRCFRGVALIESEYVQITNCTFWQCYSGAYDDGGNNKYTGCGFDSCSIGLQMTPSYANDGHGCVTGCSFNHNTLYALLCANVNNGMLFTGCQFHFATIEMRAISTGLVFTGCNFGQNIVFNFETNFIGYNVLNGCSFYSTPTFNYNSFLRGWLKTLNCYNFRDGNDVTTVSPS